MWEHPTRCAWEASSSLSGDAGAGNTHTAACSFLLVPLTPLRSEQSSSHDDAPIQTPDVSECITYMNNYSTLSCLVWTSCHCKKNSERIPWKFSLPWVFLVSIRSSGISPGSYISWQMTQAECLHFLSVLRTQLGQGALLSLIFSKRGKKAEPAPGVPPVGSGGCTSVPRESVGLVLSIWHWIRLRSGQIFFFIYDTPPPTFYFFIHLWKF